MEEKAIIAAGCFWGIEEKFRQVKGVTQTTVGYTGGDTDNPTYEDVCGKQTGHAEAVEIIFNSDVVTYKELLDIFWDAHNPTTLNRQGLDIGSQYRSAIFTTTKEQADIAEQSKKDAQSKFSSPIVTLIEPASTWYNAEEYHQKYLAKRNKKMCGL